jgi:hypothetical protein
MKHESESIDAIIDLVRVANPVADPMADTPDTEAELRVLLANLPTSAPRARQGRRRRAIRIGVVAVSAAAATAVALNLTGTGGPQGHGGFVSQAQAAEIIRQVKQTLTTYRPGEIVETLAEQHETGPGLSLWSTYNTWQSTTAPYNERVQASGGGRPSYETTVTAQGIQQTYDTATNTIYEPQAKLDYNLKPGPRAGTQTLTVPRAEVLVKGVGLPADEQGTSQLTISDSQARELRSGEAEVAYSENIIRDQQGIIGIDPVVYSDVNTAPGTLKSWAKRLESRGTQVTLDGKRAIEITVPGDGTYWFSRASLLPIKSVSRITVAHNGSPAKGYYVYTTYYKAYRILKASSAQRLMSIQAAHPSAKIVVNPLEYRLESTRLQ